MEQIGKEQQDGRFKPKHANNFIKCPYSKHSTCKTQIATLDKSSSKCNLKKIHFQYKDTV